MGPDLTAPDLMGLDRMQRRLPTFSLIILVPCRWKNTRWKRFPNSCSTLPPVTSRDPGKVYQVEGKDGRVMGKVNMPDTSTGISMHRDHGVVLASPRNGGKIEQIDDAGKLSTIIEKDPALPHPVKISMPGNSDTMVVADDMADQLVMSTIAGTKTKVYQKFDAEL